jgi:hypothetical protein
VPVVRPGLATADLPPPASDGKAAGDATVIRLASHGGH